MNPTFSPIPPQRIVTREGYPFITICLVLSILCLALGWILSGLVFTALTVFVVFFFRNPVRIPPDDPQAIVAPADGRVIFIEPLEEAPFINCSGTKVSIFMSVFNVHVNRMPITGSVHDVIYRPGKFMVASLDKASEQNERNVIVVDGDNGKRLAFAQIAGLIARRIVCYLHVNDHLNVGERIGLIRFGSRVDLYIPTPHAISVKVGDRVKSGETVIGRWA